MTGILASRYDYQADANRHMQSIVAMIEIVNASSIGQVPWPLLFCPGFCSLTSASELLPHAQRGNTLLMIMPCEELKAGQSSKLKLLHQYHGAQILLPEIDRHAMHRLTKKRPLSA